MENEWLEGEINCMEWQQLESVDMDELMFVSSLDDDTSFTMVDRTEGNTVVINTSMEYSFRFSFQEDENGEHNVYVLPYAELRHFRKYDVSVYDLEYVHQFLQEEASKNHIKTHQDHDAPTVYFTELVFPPVCVESPSGDVEVTDTLDSTMRKVMKQGENLYAQAVIRSIDHSIEEAYTLRKQYEQQIAE